jgi:thioredoxin 1
MIGALCQRDSQTDWENDKKGDMIQMRHHKHTPDRNNARIVIAGIVAAGLTTFHAGCGRSEKAPSAATPAAESAPHTIDTPALFIPAGAPTLESVFPSLSSGILRGARITELPGDLVLQADGLAITKAELENEISENPPPMQATLRQNAFFLLEEMATDAILRAHVIKTNPALKNTPAMLQTFFAGMLEGLAVTHEQVSSFYEENRDMIGEASLEQVQTAIEEILLQQKQKEVINGFIRNLGKTEPIAIDKSWLETHAALAMDNPIDRARASGTPTFVSFGADTCMPCQQLKPIREEIAREYGERLNVVYIKVQEEHYLAVRYGVQGIPHIIFFDAEGKESFTHTGFMPKDRLEAQIQNLGVSL